MIHTRIPITMTILSVLVLFSTGCSLVESPRVAARRMTRMFTPNPDDWESGADEESSKWDFVGKEGRGDAEREKDPDPLYTKFLMSKKSVEIHRSLGID